MNARADEVVLARHVQAGVGRAGGDQDRVRAVLAAVGRMHVAVAVVQLDGLYLLRGQDLDPEAPRLLRQPVGQIRAADAVRPAGEVVQPLGDARLAADPGPLDDQASTPSRAR